ncbi:MAG: DNA polymerase III subunit beta [Candidatus Dependentiae bacterium]|nr:DNA polymerase III subunit beta [Candidatus Dependentiae bacterium]
MSNRFILEQKQLAATLGFMQPICSKKTTMQATSLILFHVTSKELILKATDLEISLQYTCNIKESSIENQQFLVAGKKIFDIVRELDNDIIFTLKKNQLDIQSGKVQLSLNIKDAQEFPPLPERIENLMHIDREFLLDMFTKVSFLIPQNNATPSLNGLFLEISPDEFKMTSTDGHCLAQVKSDKYVLAENKKWLTPRRAIFEIKKILENCSDEMIFIGVCNNQLVFSGESFNFFTKLLADQFPAYEAILKKDGFIPARVSRGDFIKTLRRSSCLLSGQFLATSFNFTPNQLKVCLKNNEVGSMEEILAMEDYSADELEMRFYSPYLLNGLQSLPGDNVTCYLKNNTRPIIFESIDKNSQMVYLVMPVSATK